MKGHHATFQPPPFIPTPIPENMKSKKFQPSDLPVGSAVFYRGERYYIESCPSSWDETAHVRISDKRIRPEPGMVPPSDRTMFGVHPDLLEIAPEGSSKYGKQPTQKAVIAKKERDAKGIKDAGDVVAELLRGMDLDGVYAIAADFLNEAEDELRAKAGHLNNGQQRMWCGNRMRNFMKKNAK